MYPDPKKAEKKQRYIDSLANIEKKIARARKNGESTKELQDELKNLDIEKSLGLKTEEQIENDVCNGDRDLDSCTGDVDNS